MVRLADWFLLGACTLLSVAYATPQPVISPVAVLERAADDRTKVVTRTTTGKGGKVRTLTTTRTISKATSRKTHSTRTRKSTRTKSMHTTSTHTKSMHTKSTATTHKSHKTTSTTTATHTGHKTTTKTSTHPTPSSTPQACIKAEANGGKYTASNGVVFNIQCGEIIGGDAYSTTTSSSFENCLNLCAGDAICEGFHWDYPQQLVPGTCFLYNVPVAFVSSFISDAGRVIKRPS